MFDGRAHAVGSPRPQAGFRGTGSEGWAISAYHACDLIGWITRLNLLWIAFTLLGGVILGAGPATVAAHTLARRRLRGETFRATAEFAKVWRAELVRGNVLFLPVATIAALLALNWVAFGSAGTPGSAVIAGLVIVAAVLTAVSYAILMPLYVHYELPLRSYPAVASRFVFADPASAAVLLVAAAGVVTATALIPGLLPFVSIGAWIHLDTALCLSFFAKNDERVAAHQHGQISQQQGSLR